MALNPLSAELVASFSHNIKGETISCEIMVLASMDRVVDNLTAHSSCVHHLMWSPNGTHIATAGDDETLNIWNFFGNSQKKIDDLSVQKKSMLKLKSSLDLNNVFNLSR